MLYEVKPKHVYYSPSKLPFEVLHIGRHAQDCSLAMVVFTNLTPTHDRPTGEVWVLAESLFIKQFSESENGY